MSMSTPVIGYPVHRVATFSRWANQHGARFTDWTAACGAHGTSGGHSAFGRLGNARRAELCTPCFPTGHSGFFPDSEEVPR